MSGVIIQNSFSSYSLNDEDVLQGSLLNVLQKQVLQNQLSLIAQEKINLDYDPNEPMRFLQQESFKKGQMSIIQFILDSSIAAEEELKFRDNPRPAE